MSLDTIAAWLGRLVMAGFAALVLAELVRYFKTALAAPVEPRARRERLPAGRLLAQVLAAFLASRLLVVLACGAYYWAAHRGLEGFFPALSAKLLPWDADHYLGLIERWYVAEGDARLHIVFLPFYPAICRGLRALTGLSPFAAAEVVSNLALVGCGAAVFRLAEMDGGPELGRRAMLLLMFNPMAYFYSIPYTESAFLLLTLLAVLCARRRRFVPAVLLGAMAANTRIVGMAVAIPIFWEMLRSEREAGEGRVSPRRAALCVLKVLPVSAGLLLYLYGNARLHGNPTQFMVFQRENWYQQFGSMAYTFRYSLINALGYEDRLYRVGVWIPQALLLLAVPPLLLWRRGKERPGDAAYLLVFHYVSFAPTWLLSGPRYLSACYALYPLLARIPRSRRGFAALLAGQCALLIVMSILGLWLVKVY